MKTCFDSLLSMEQNHVLRYDFIDFLALHSLIVLLMKRQEAIRAYMSENYRDQVEESQASYPDTESRLTLQRYRDKLIDYVITDKARILHDGEKLIRPFYHALTFNQSLHADCNPSTCTTGILSTYDFMNNLLNSNEAAKTKQRGLREASVLEEAWVMRRLTEFHEQILAADYLNNRQVSLIFYLMRYPMTAVTVESYIRHMRVTIH